MPSRRRVSPQAAALLRALRITGTVTKSAGQRVGGPRYEDGSLVPQFKPGVPAPGRVTVKKVRQPRSYQPRGKYSA